MELLKICKEALERVKATDIKIYDLRGVSPLFDFTVIATVDALRQANAVIEHIEDLSKGSNLNIRGVEGKDSTWLLVDLSDVILHVMTKEERENYSLDKLYSNVPLIDYEKL